MCTMTKFAKPKQYMETFQFVQVDILKYKRYPSAFGFNKPLTTNYQKNIKKKYVQVLSMNGMTNSLPKSSSQTSNTPRLPTSPKVSPLSKTRNRWWSQTRASVESSSRCRSSAPFGAMSVLGRSSFMFPRA